MTLYRIVVLNGSSAGTAIDAAGGRITIGRTPENQLCIPQRHVSSHHGEIRAVGPCLVYRDLESSNGSVVRRGPERIPVDAEVGHEIELSEGDEIVLGDPQSPVVLGVQRRADSPMAIVDGSEKTVVVTRDVRETARIEQNLRQDASGLSRVVRLLRDLNARFDRAGLLKTAADALFDAFPEATHLLVALEDPGGHGLMPDFAATRAGPRSEPVALSRTLLRTVLSRGEAMLFDDALSEVTRTDSLVASHIRSAIVAPLWTGRETVGLVQVDNRDRTGAFSQGDLDLLVLFAGPLAQVLSNLAFHERLADTEGRLRRENITLRRQAGTVDPFAAIVGSSAVLQSTLRLVEKVFDTDTTVLVLGETGTGKELVARAIHAGSPRRDRPFVPANCGALPEGLLESALFGHRRGAFTGAVEDRKGLFELADGGTLFLDEVGEMTPALQVRLLRVLDEGEVMPLGGTRSRKVDVRIVTATNRDLKIEVDEGRFRADLYYRLNVFPVALPPLRERREDIRFIAQHFLADLTRASGRGPKGFTPEALQVLSEYPFPGNVRELRNAVERAVTLAGPEPLIGVDLLPDRLKQLPQRGWSPKSNTTLKARLEDIEAQLIREYLEESGGNQSEAARRMGISRVALFKKMGRLSIESPRRAARRIADASG